MIARVLMGDIGGMLRVKKIEFETSEIIELGRVQRVEVVSDHLRTGMSMQGSTSNERVD